MGTHPFSLPSKTYLWHQNRSGVCAPSACPLHFSLSALAPPRPRRCAAPPFSSIHMHPLTPHLHHLHASSTLAVSCGRSCSLPALPALLPTTPQPSGSPRFPARRRHIPAFTLQLQFGRDPHRVIIEFGRGRQLVAWTCGSWQRAAAAMRGRVWAARALPRRSPRAASFILRHNAHHHCPHSSHGRLLHLQTRLGQSRSHSPRIPSHRCLCTLARRRSALPRRHGAPRTQPPPCARDRAAGCPAAPGPCRPHGHASYRVACKQHYF